jgi:hypothetical protein
MKVCKIETEYQPVLKIGTVEKETAKTWRVQYRGWSWTWPKNECYTDPGEAMEAFKMATDACIKRLEEQIRRAKEAMDATITMLHDAKKEEK